ncbi:MAG TPA: TIM-barrel domain-containing protein [Gaiellaceae bacterium]|nr:TIM-barrel domain-containing protein [Gaiellaceae bacterium]
MKLRPLILVAALAALAGCGGSHDAAPGITIHVDTSPFRISVLRDGKTVVTEDKDARLRYQLTSTGDQYFLTKVISHDGDTYRVATNEPGGHRTATVKVTQTATGADIDLALHPATGIQQVYDAFDSAPNEHFLGGGENDEAVDLRGQILGVEVGYQCSYTPIPYFASSAGWALRLASQNPAAMAFAGSPGGEGCQIAHDPPCTFPALPTRTEVCLQGTELHENLYVGSFAQTLHDYQAETGEPVVPPPSELELIKWRDEVDGPADILQDISRFQAAGIPLGWVLLDNPWEQCNGVLTFDKSRIPDPAGLIDKVHARGVLFMLWVSPRATCPEGYPGKPLGAPGSQILDLRDPGVVAEFQRRIRALVALGVDGVKADRGDENDLRTISLSLTNDYPLLYQRAVMDALPEGSAAIFRAGTVGSQAVAPGMWSGDLPEEWVGLQRAIVAGQTIGMSGFPTWGSDIGGYQGPPFVTAELLVRWAQFGAVSPVMEIGGVGANSTPWTLGPAAMSGLKAAAILHYELFPYLYGLLQRHQPVLRPLAFEFPDTAKAWDANFETLVGPDLLAAPVAGPGVTPTVYLPPGSWVDLYTGTHVAGGRSFTRPTPLDQFPLYVRAGAVVPFNLRTATGSWWGVNELSHPGRAGFLATNGTSLALTGQPGDVQLFVPAPRRPRTVTFAGKRVAWSWNAGPLPGVVIHLHGPTVRGAVVLSS